jgi:hypothetical protein
MRPAAIGYTAQRQCERGNQGKIRMAGKRAVCCRNALTALAAAVDAHGIKWTREMMEIYHQGMLATLKIEQKEENCNLRETRLTRDNWLAVLTQAAR